MKAVVLAAGQGTRLRPVTNCCQKAMLPLNGRPLLEYTLANLAGVVEEAVVVVGYREEDISGYFGDRYGGLPVRYVRQTGPAGTAAALLAARSLVPDSRLLVVLGDVYCSRQQAVDMQAQDAEVALCLARVDDPENHKPVCTRNGVVTAFGGDSQWIDRGTWLVSPYVLDYIAAFGRTQGELRFLNVLDRMMGDGHEVAGVQHPEPWIQIGDHEGVAGVIAAQRKLQQIGARDVLPEEPPRPLTSPALEDSHVEDSVVFGSGTIRNSHLARSLVYCGSRLEGVQLAEGILCVP